MFKEVNEWPQTDPTIIEQDILKSNFYYCTTCIRSLPPNAQCCIWGWQPLTNQHFIFNYMHKLDFTTSKIYLKLHISCRDAPSLRADSIAEVDVCNVCLFSALAKYSNDIMIDGWSISAGKLRRKHCQHDHMQHGHHNTCWNNVHWSINCISFTAFDNTEIDLMSLRHSPDGEILDKMSWHRNVLNDCQRHEP